MPKRVNYALWTLSAFVLCNLALHLGVRPRNTEAQQVPHYLPSGGAVPDAKTAVRIAEAVLDAAYGEKTMDKEKPLTAALRGDVWTVQGTMPKEFRNGGVGVVQISRRRGCILGLVHYK
jgi:hypothetical protein